MFVEIDISLFGVTVLLLLFHTFLANQGIDYYCLSGSSKQIS